jgi:hypothetical protein
MPEHDKSIKTVDSRGVDRQLAEVELAGVRGPTGHRLCDVTEVLGALW